MASTLFHLTSPNSTAPAAANSVTCTPSGTAWTFGAYVTNVSAVAVDTLIIGISALVLEGFSNAASWEIELATGAAGSEVTIATFCGSSINADNAYQHHLTLPLPIKVPAGSRIASRIRKSTGDTHTGQIDLITVPTSYTGTLYPTTTKIDCVPYGSAATVTCGASAWTNGAVTVLSASMPTDAVIFALKCGPTLLGWPGEFELDLMTGASGSEVPISGIRDVHAGQDEPGWADLPAPVFVAAGTRLSVRIRSSNRSANSALVGAMYYQAPGADWPSDLLATAAPVFAPAAASGVSVTSGSGNVYGAWVQVLASAAVAYALCDAIIDTIPDDGHIQVGVGASGSEVAIATLGVGGSNGNAGSSDGALPVPVASIAAGQRVAIRYVTAAATQTTLCALILLPTSGLTALQTTTQPMVMPVTCDPNGINVIGPSVPSGGSSWASGAWVQVTAGNTNPGAMYAIGFSIPTNENQFEVDVGVGAAGSEAVIYTFRSVNGGNIGGRFILMADALIPFAAATRVAVRLRLGAVGGNSGVAVYYYDNLVFTPPVIVGSGAIGFKAKVTNTLAWLFNLDGVARTNATSGLFQIGGAFTVTGVATFLSAIVLAVRIAYSQITQASTASLLLGRGSASGGGDWQEITLGSNLSMVNQVLSASGGGGGGGGTGGAWVLLGSYTASAQATLPVATRNATGQSGAIIQSDFDDYVIRIENMVPATASVNCQMRMSTNGGSSYDNSSLYVTSLIAFNSTGSAAGGNAIGSPTTQITLNDGFTAMATDANYGLSGIFRLVNPGGSAHKIMHGEAIFKSTVLQAVRSGAEYQSTTPVNAFNFFFSSGNIASAIVRVYGVQKSATRLYTQLAQVVTSGSQTSVDFPSIPSGYSALKVIYTSQDTQGGTSSVPLTMKVNADATAADYAATSRSGVQNAAAVTSDVAASTSGAYVGVHPQSGNTGLVASGEITIPNYAGTTNNKRFHAVNAARDGTNGGTVLTLEGEWKSASAINELTLLPGGTAFENGSVFTLYGIP